MRFLFDILHPAHVHVLRNPRTELLARGHDVVVTSRDKDVAVDLLDAYSIPHTVLSTQQTGTVALGTELVRRTAKLIRLARAERIDVLVGLMGPSIAPAGRVLRRPSFVLYDTEVATRTNRWVYPLATEVITPRSYTGPVSGNHTTYAGYHELAYLHPNRFTPDRHRLAAFGLGERPYVLVRLPSLDSSHDSAEVKASGAAWLDGLSAVRDTHTIVVSSEGPPPATLADLRLEGPLEDIHHVLAYADVVVGESATMAAEAAVLGTPAVFVGTTSRGYVDDIERRYGLISRFTPDEFPMAMADATAIATATDHGRWRDAQARLLDEHVDVTSWIVDHLLSVTDDGAP
jgi:predicted glycosyltransferase